MPCMHVHRDRGLLSSLGIRVDRRNHPGEGSPPAHTKDNPVRTFRGLAFGVIFQLAAALIGFGLWHLLRNLL